MTPAELHEILDDENKKITLKEFREILYQLKNDCFEELSKQVLLPYNQGFYNGEINAFYIALDLSEHIEEGKDE